MNDGVNPEWCSLSYISVDDVARRVVELGRGTKLGKIDIKSAYKIIHFPSRPVTLRDGMARESICRCQTTLWTEASSNNLHSSGRCSGVDRKNEVSVPLSG